MWVVCEFCRNQQIAPVDSCESDRLSKLGHATAAQLERRKTDAIHRYCVCVGAERQVVSALVAENGPHEFPMRCSEEQSDPLFGCLRERRCAGISLSHHQRFDQPTSSSYATFSQRLTSASMCSGDSMPMRCVMRSFFA